MPARRTVASYMTDTAAWVGDRGIQTVEEQRSVIRLRASLVDAMGVMKRSKKRTKKEMARLQRAADVLKKKLVDCSFALLSRDVVKAFDLQLKLSAKQDAKQDDCSQPPGANARNIGRRIRVKSACPLYVRPSQEARTGKTPASGGDDDETEARRGCRLSRLDLTDQRLDGGSCSSAVGGVDDDLELEEYADQNTPGQLWTAYRSTTAVAGEKIAAVADAERPKASTMAPPRAKEQWRRTCVSAEGCGKHYCSLTCLRAQKLMK